MTDSLTLRKDPVLLEIIKNLLTAAELQKVEIEKLRAAVAELKGEPK